MGRHHEEPLVGAEPPTALQMSGPEESEGNHTDTIWSTVRFRTGVQHDRVDTPVTQLVAQPQQMRHVVI
jgi:hypothetical protein